MTDTVMVKADTSGNFSGIIPVPAIAPGDYRSHSMTVMDGASQITLNNILIGEVWLCSGQSNMQFPVKEVLDSTAEVAAAQYPHLRLLNVDLNFSATPCETFKGRWMECSPRTAAGFSAVGYYFGRELLKTLDVPVGIVFSGIGASAAQAYVPQPVLAADTQLNRIYLQPYLNSPRSKEVIDGGFSFEKVTRPFLLYNAMIYPLRRMSIKGICWYQGEANRMERDSYTHLTKTLIKSWRHLFGQDKLPFYYVQVAPFFWDKDDDTLADYSFFREAQEKVSELDNTAMVTTVDVGEAKNLHPHNKKPIGIRLAQTALNKVYGRSDVPWHGPQYQHMEINGRKAVVFFQPGTTTGGLQGDPLRSRWKRLARRADISCFTIAGPDQKFYPAQATIDGDKIIVWSPKVNHPAAVRYAFTNMAVTHLHNGQGWPVVPFRTDNWPEPQTQNK
jgi:sialate O-acetylesterase